jgi:hypothetical protein
MTMALQRCAMESVLPHLNWCWFAALAVTFPSVTEGRLAAE